MRPNIRLLDRTLRNNRDKVKEYTLGVDTKAQLKLIEQKMTKNEFGI